MSRIAGITSKGKQDLVKKMLDKLSYKGSKNRAIFDSDTASLGFVSSFSQCSQFAVSSGIGVQDYAGEGYFAKAQMKDGRLVLTRDPLGVAPLYCGIMNGRELCFASEVKALLDITKEVYEAPPGCRWDGTTTQALYQLHNQNPLDNTPAEIARELHRRLDDTIRDSIEEISAGVWLSGGMEAMAIAAIASKYTGKLHTFAGGYPDSPELEYARTVASHIHADHHEIVFRDEDLLPLLPEIIYHLESFDTQTVRSGITNYILARASTDYVEAFITDGGGKELFAGYEYLKNLPHAALSDELLDITRRLHNTTLQRIDRCTAAYGLKSCVPFLRPQVLDYALSIPVEYKLRDGVERWILRQAMAGILPSNMHSNSSLNSLKGTAIGERLGKHAENTVSKAEFDREQTIPNGWTLRNKEELMYYRIFKSHFGILPKLEWMGRSKHPDFRPADPLTLQPFRNTFPGL